MGGGGEGGGGKGGGGEGGGGEGSRGEYIVYFPAGARHLGHQTVKTRVY